MNCKIIYYMNIFDRYISVNYLKIFSAVTAVALGLTVIYSLTDFLLGFRVVSFGVGLSYVLNLIPLGFYILSSLMVNVSLLILFRRIFSRKLDLTAQSFGLSPLRFSLFLIGGVFLLSALFLLLNESFLPSLFKRVWYIEKTYKKKQEVGRIVDRLWFVKETERGKYYVFVESLDVESGRFTGLFMLVTSPGGEVLEVVEGTLGRWKGHVIYVDRGSAYNFREGYFVEELRDFSLGTEVGLEEIGIFAEKMEHVRISSLLTLYIKGSRLGLDTDRYLSEVLYRAGMSFLPFIVFLPLLASLFRFRSLGAGMASFLIHLIAGWLVVISPKLLADKAGLPPHYALIGYTLLLAYLLKGTHDLAKGFRI